MSGGGTGTIVFWKLERGFGFIEPDASNRREDNVFFIYRALKGLEQWAINPGTRVRFEIEPGGDRGRVRARLVMPE